MATFMEVLDTSIANVSLPHIAGSLSVSTDEGTWVLTSYLVSNAIVLPISGWLASKIGRKRFYMMCVAFFTLSSFLCGLAPSLGWLIFFRILQGLGGGGLGPCEQSILADTFPPAKRGMAFAVYGMAVVLAPAIGPTLGGFVTDHYTWRWIFFINVPVGITSLFLANHFVSDPPYVAIMKARAGRVDYAGLALIAIGLGTLEVVLDKGQEDDWFVAPLIVWFTILAAASLVSFAIWEWKSSHPVVDVQLFRDRNFAISNLMMFVLGVSLFSTTLLLPEYMQTVMGYSAEESGIALSPGGFTVMLLMPLVGFLVSRVDPRYLIGFGFALLSLSLLYMTAHLYPGMDFKTATLLRVYQSAALAFLFVPINTLVYSGVPLEKNNAVSGIVNLSRNLGGDVGIAFLTTFIARRSQKHQVDLSAHTTPYYPQFHAKLLGLAEAARHAGTAAADAMQAATATMYRQVLSQATTLAYIDTLKVLAIGVAMMLPLLLFTRRPKAGALASGH